MRIAAAGAFHFTIPGADFPFRTRAQAPARAEAAGYGRRSGEAPLLPSAWTPPPDGRRG